MEDPQKEKDIIITVDKVLGLIIAVFGILSVLALIWGMWKVMQTCFTVVFLSVVAVVLIPSDY